MRPIIRVENLSKEFRIGQRDAPYATLRESVAKAARAPFRRARQIYLNARQSLASSPLVGEAPLRGQASLNGHSRADRFWALKDVSFEVQPGEVVGIIGRNGAGKSTLLKILSRITEPTTGSVDLYGRVGSLLEVGTGFHPELTGRENIYLNGAILGMSRRDIDRRFDEIVDFAEVEKFIDTPVKRYSSGMYVRLAFAVAAHLSTEILLIDEVLAVGDVSFQKRCLGQIARISKQGRTILFVSHNLPAVKALCNRAVRIHRGQVKDDSESANVVTRYLVDEASNAQPEHKWNENTSAPGDENIRLTAIRAVGASNQLAAVHSSNDPLFIEMEVTVLRSHPSLVVSFELIHHTGVVVLKSCHTDGRDGHMPYFNIGRNVARCEIPAGLLCSGTYHVSPKIFLHGIGWIYNGDRAIAFDVTLDHGAYEHADPRFNGVIAPCFTWTRI